MVEIEGISPAKLTGAGRRNRPALCLGFRPGSDCGLLTKSRTLGERFVGQLQPRSEPANFPGLAADECPVACRNRAGNSPEIPLDLWCKTFGFSDAARLRS